MLFKRGAGNPAGLDDTQQPHRLAQTESPGLDRPMRFTSASPWAILIPSNPFGHRCDAAPDVLSRRGSGNLAALARIALPCGPHARTIVYQPV